MADEALEAAELCSEELDIDLTTENDDELFEWFLASLLFGGRISEGIAKRTYRAFESHDLLTPGRMVDAGFAPSWTQSCMRADTSDTTINAPGRFSATARRSSTSTVGV